MIEKIKMRLVLTFILIYLLLLSTVNSGAIIPDPVNPLLIRWSNVNQFDTMPTNNSSFKRNSVIINFTLPATSAGLAFGNYIGISFPLRIGPSELLFDKTETINGVLTPRFSCLLTDGTINYNMTPAASASNPIIKTLPVETNIAYCKFNDKVNDRLAVNKSYRITIVLNSLVKLTSLYWDDVGIGIKVQNKG